MAGGRRIQEQDRGEQEDHARTLKRVARAFSPYKWQIALVVLSILVTTVLGLVDPFVLRSIFDDAIGKHNAHLLMILVSIMIFMPMLRGVIDIAQGYLNNRIGQGVMRDFRRGLYAHLQRMSLHFFTITRTGEIQSRLSNDVGGIQDFVTYTAPNVVSNVATALSGLIAMIVISPLLTGISLGLLPFFLWITGRIGHVRRTTTEETQNSFARLTSLIQETLSLSGILLMKTYGRQQYAQERFDRENQTLTDLQVRQHMVGRWLFMLMDTLFSLTPAVIFLVAGLRIINHPEHAKVTLGGIVAFTAIQIRLFAPLEQLLHVRVELHGVLALFDRIFACLDLPVEIQDAPNAIHFKAEEMRGKVTFSRVSFSYKCAGPRLLNSAPAEADDGDHDCNGEGRGVRNALAITGSPGLRSCIQPDNSRANVLGLAAPGDKRVTLRDISFEIRPGQLVALVGPSGAGKTTITYLLARLYDVDNGSVSIDGYDTRQISLVSLSEMIGVVTQETYLFHTSVRENLLFARPSATEEEMIEAAKAAAIHDRILELPDGYDSVVGERGHKLSGGEKQRLAIARVVLKDPRILILDEATSALDTHSERLIQAALGRVTRNRSTLAIAHRLSTILAADLILVVDRGEIVERGTHGELLERGEIYGRLYHEQFSRPPSPDSATPEFAWRS